MERLAGKVISANEPNSPGAIRYRSVISLQNIYQKNVKYFAKKHHIFVNFGRNLRVYPKEIYRTDVLSRFFG